MQYPTSLITADGAYHCPVGSIRPFFTFGCCQMQKILKNTIWEICKAPPCPRHPISQLYPYSFSLKPKQAIVDDDIFLFSLCLFLLSTMKFQSIWKLHWRFIPVVDNIWPAFTFNVSFMTRFGGDTQSRNRWHDYVQTFFSEHGKNLLFAIFLCL